MSQAEQPGPEQQPADNAIPADGNPEPVGATEHAAEQEVAASEHAPSVQDHVAEPQTDPVAEVAATADAPPGSLPAGAVYPDRHHGLFGVQSFLTVVISSIFVITFIVQAFQIPTGSMENTLLVGDFLLVDKLHFAGLPGSDRFLPYGKIDHGDIIVFYYPVDPSQFLVKRVIGLPGDHVHLRDKTVYVNGVPLRESYVIHRNWIPDFYRDNFPSLAYSQEIDRRWRNQMQNYVHGGEIVVPDGQYFVMGDNRDQSLDSRYWGFVPRANIVGRPLVIYLSVKGRGQGGSDDKILHSEELAHLLHMARWDRIFRLVR